MKIKSLWVSEYKNLRNIDLKFKSDLITLLVGQNGLGKSNLIEILTIIFRDLDLLENEDDYTAWSYYADKGHFEFIINFDCNNYDVIITIKKELFEVKVKSIGTVQEYEILSFTDFKNRRKLFLPKYVIGYYSGENKRIKELIEKHVQKEKKNQRDFHRRKTKPEQSLRKIFFAENFHSQLLLLTLAVYREKLDYKDLIDNFFSEYLEIESVDKFDIRFNNPPSKYYRKLNKSADYFLENVTNKREGEEVENPFWNLKGKINLLLEILFNHHLANDSYLIYPNDGDDKRRFINEFLELKNTTIAGIQDEIYEKFPHPLDFFDALESSSVVEILNDIDITVKKAGIENPIKFSQLSEGQQQLLSVVGLILVTGKEDCLFLLDEPDTHINPKWQRNFASLLREYNLNGSKSHIFLATHSPLLVQAYEDEDLFLFRRNGDEVIIDTENHQIKNWRIDQVLVSDYFNLPSARPPKIDDYISLRAQILTKRIITPDDEELLKKHENDFGVFPTGETIEDIEAMMLIREINQNIKK